MASQGSSALLPRTTTDTGDTATKAQTAIGTAAPAPVPAATAPAQPAATPSVDAAPRTPEASSPGSKPQTPATGSAETKPVAPAATPVAESMPRATPTGPEAPEATVGTDAAFASTVPCPPLLHTLRNISEVRHFFRTNDVPIFFIGATPFNLLGLDRWVRNFTYVSYYDAWDGAHPRVFTPAHKPYREFGSGEEINNWLLLNPEVRTRMTKDLRPGVRPKVAMVFFDTETEQICEELGYDLILPSAALRHRLDSKITTTVLGNEAGVSSVPNVLGTGSDYKTLRAAADAAGLGEELVVQTPYGDSGKTTYFINSEADWEKHSTGIVGEEIKIMRRINNLPVAVEAVLTRSGTLVGPFLTELAGHEDLTPYPGGWCGNEMHPDVFTDSQRARATELVKRMGDRLATEGYRGFFEVDVLVDTDTDKVYLGELNPRISGASAITNVTAGAYADVPLFLFHLLEYMDVEFELDIEEINQRWEALSGADVWSQMVIKETSETLELLTATPATGQYHLDANGALVFGRPAMDWHMLQNESEAFFLRVYGPGDYRWKGGDLGILVTKGRLQVERNGSRQLSIRARHFIDSIRAGFAGLPLGGAVLEQEIRSDGAVEVNVHSDGVGIGVQSRW
ncbi:biotin carboxylase [Arthrobacter sp. AQ5-05]|nr:biotin carboxylase [Arthrobacter sp. AQ5-05]